SHAGHEQVVFCQDVQTGLRAIIAIYSTALGPALGGTRFYPYPDEDAALADVLNLSRAMAYKNALAELDLGGGKAVIIGDPARGATSKRRRSARTAGSYRRGEAVTSPPATSARTARTWTSSPANAGTSPAGPRRTVAPAIPPSSPPSACSGRCAPPPSTCGAP